MKWVLSAILLFVTSMTFAAEDEVTYTKHVATILFKHCANCHRTGEVGPFPLLTYQDAAKRAKHIQEVTASGRMPPWKPEAGAHKFVGERRLGEQERKSLAQWATTGAKEGDPKDLPPAPQFPVGWQLGQPDLVLKMPKPFAVHAGPGDLHQTFVIPIPIETDKTIAAVEVRPGNRRVVHHALLFLDAAGQAKKRDPNGDGYRTFGGPGIIPTGGLGAWAPGLMPRYLPEGMGMYIRKGSDLVLQIHYNPSGKVEQDQTQVGLHFTKKPAETIVAGLAVANPMFYIPAGAKQHKVTAECEPFPVPVKLIGIGPHMHLLGREMTVKAHLPDGKVLPLIKIGDWDFNWQNLYHYTQPIPLPKGSVVRLEAIYDNSTENPLNPANPPRPVRWGEATTDEMCLLALQLITDNRDDLRQVSRMRGARLGAALAGGIPEEPVGSRPFLQPQQTEDRTKQLAPLAYWPQFRGPGSAGLGAGTNLPEKWSTAENVAWKTNIPGKGWSSPIVWGNRVILTSVIGPGPVEAPRQGLYIENVKGRPADGEHRWMVYCLDLATGKILWERLAHKGTPPGALHVKNTYASATPVTDGERVYVSFGDIGLFCYNVEGKSVWEQKWPAYPTRFGWGPAASPALLRDRLFVVNDNEEQSYLVALDAKTGKQIWRVERDEKSNWATPFVWGNDERIEIVTAGSGKVRSYDLNGKTLWELAGMSSISIPTPFASQGLLYVTSGYVLDRQRPVYAIRPGASGDISVKDEKVLPAHLAWHQPMAGPYHPTPVAYGEYLYVLLDRGFLSCYEARTGKEIYGRERLGSTAFTASPWAYDGKIFCLSEDGDTFVIQAGPQFKVLGRNRLEEMCMATPAIAGNRVLIRTLTHLYAIGKPGP